MCFFLKLSSAIIMQQIYEIQLFFPNHSSLQLRCKVTILLVLNINADSYRWFCGLSAIKRVLTLILRFYITLHLCQEYKSKFILRQCESLLRTTV